MPNVQRGGPIPYNQLTDPPTARDGMELYIEKLLTRHGMPPSSKNQDMFEKAGVPSAQKNKTFADKLLKWTGIIFAATLGVVGLRHLFGGAVKNTAGKAAQAVVK